MSNTVAIALIGPIAVLLGVWLSNRNSRQQVRLAAAAEADRARLFEMRRDVFLGAAQAIARASNAFALAVQASLAEAMAQLRPRRRAMLARNDTLTELQRLIAAQVADKQLRTEIIKQQNGCGRWEGTAPEALQRQFDYSEQLRVDLVRQHDRLMDEQVSELQGQVWLAAQLADKHLELVQQAAVVCRNELGLESGADRIRNILSEAAARYMRPWRQSWNEHGNSAAANIALTRRRAAVPSRPSSDCCNT